MFTYACIGLGNRGREYLKITNGFYKKKARLVAICDTSEQAIHEISKKYRLPKECCFGSSEEFFAKGKLADAIIISTQDKSHYAIGVKAIELGYNVLMEKPVSASLPECFDLKRRAERQNVKLVVCHVLRYSTYYSKLKSLIDSGIIGNIIAINHTENVGYFHFAHSFVRGNWKREEDSSPSILAKCCHDLDLIQWFMNAPCKRVTSAGGLTYFCHKNAPDGATDRCTEACKSKSICPYNAERLYLTDPLYKAKFIKFMPRTLTGKSKNTRVDIYTALKHGDYGKCVFLNDNDVADYQTVTMDFGEGRTAVLTMNGLSQQMFRQSHIIGEKGELICYKNRIKLKLFGRYARDITVGGLILPGHLEGDLKLIKNFVKLMNGEATPQNDVTTIDSAIPSHQIAIAAEISRKNGSTSVDPSTIK